MSRPGTESSVSRTPLRRTIDDVTFPLQLDACRRCGWSYIVGIVAWNDAGESELRAGVGFGASDLSCTEE